MNKLEMLNLTNAGSTLQYDKYFYNHTNIIPEYDIWYKGREVSEMYVSEAQEAYDFYFDTLIRV